ncbi:MAG: alpha-galactosidase, partial [Alistipes sp.]|nr:alpha-galactosidase [Alistipes sp.]
MKNNLKLILLAVLASLICATSAVGQTQPIAPDNSKYILTPPAPDTPRINSARVFGVRPKAEFRYTIAATGIRPMT